MDIVDEILMTGKFDVNAQRSKEDLEKMYREKLEEQKRQIELKEEENRHLITQCRELEHQLKHIGYIYVASFEDGEKYIGQTIQQPPEERFKQHLKTNDILK